MDWNAAVERNREALRRVLAGLRVMAHIDAGDERPGPLPRILHRAVLRLLRPAEAAVRRLVIVAARGIDVTLPNAQGAKAERTDGAAATPPPPRLAWGLGARQAARPGKRPRRGGKAGTEPRPRKPCLCLFDPPRRPGRRRTVAPWRAPRISVPGITELHRLPPPPNPFDELDTVRIAWRLAALADALDDLPRHALRFARWQARRGERSERSAPAGRQAGARKGRRRPLRSGHPPGHHPRRCGREPHEVHKILETLHDLALWAMEPHDTS